MEAYSPTVIIFICCICRYASVEIMPELKKNILSFGYGIKLKYEEMLAHSFDRFMWFKIYLPTGSDLKLFTIHFNETYDYLKEENGCNHISKEYITDLRPYSKKMVPFIHYYRKQFFSYNFTPHDFLMNKIPLILPNVQKPNTRREVYLLC